MLQQVQLNDRKLFYRETGKGAPVLLLHGFGEDSSIWKLQADALQGYRLIMPDLPGTGGSEPATDMSMEGLADTVHGLMTALKISTFTFIGHSMGGYIAMAFAEKYPGMLKGLGLFHSSAAADNEEKKAARRKGIAFIQEHGAFPFLQTAIPNLFSADTKASHPELVEAQLAAARQFSARSLVLYYEAMMERPSRLEVLKSVAVPVLFVMGKHDTAVPLKDGLEQSYLPRLSYIHILESSGHLGMIEEPAEATAILMNYLNSIHQTP